MTAVADSDRRAYRRDGVVLLRGVFAPCWIELLLEGLEHNVAAPGPMARMYADNRADAWFFYDTLNLSRIPQYARFLFESPAAKIAGRLTGAREVRLFNDIVFYRGRGTQTASPFHQDLPHWCFDSAMSISLWMPLVPVESRSALEFVPGSHRWKRLYARPEFSAIDVHTPDNPAEYEPLPDIAARRVEFGVISWDMEPGDCLMFDGMTVHGGSGRLRPDRPLKVFGANWMGEDAVFHKRPGGTDPDLSAICAVNGIAEGDPLACDAFPVVWKG